MVMILKVQYKSPVLSSIYHSPHNIDIAISAPFGEGSGTVYIYIGRLGNQRIQCTPSQVHSYTGFVVG